MKLIALGRVTGFWKLFKTQNAHDGRNVMPRCLSEGVDIFLKSAERQGGANRTFATGGRCHGWQLEPCPYGLELLYHFSLENSHLETRHQGVMFRSPRAFVVPSLTLKLVRQVYYCMESDFRNPGSIFIEKCLRYLLKLLLRHRTFPLRR